MTIDRYTYNMILTAFPSVPPEAGGILGSNGDVVCTFEFDPGIPELERAVYTPNVRRLNAVIAKWDASGIQFCGIIHSHPPGHYTLSDADREYIQVIMNHMPSQINRLFFPILIPGESVIPYLAQRTSIGVTITSDKLTLKET